MWKADSGLHLWVEQVEGHRVLAHVDYVSLPAGDRGVFAVLERGSISGVDATLRTPKGVEVQRTIPTRAFYPAAAVAVLVELQEFTYSRAIAPDLRFFIDVTRGLEAFARSGRAFVSLLWEAGEWWPQWRLPDGLTETAWRAQVAQRTPPVLIANGGPGVPEEFINRMFHWVTNALLADLDEPSGTRQTFVKALLESESLKRAAPSVAASLAKWRMSATADDVRLLLVVEEPAHSSEDIGLATELDIAGLLDIVSSERGEDAPGQNAEEGTLWPVRMYFRVGVSAPERLDPELCRRSVLQLLRPQMQKAQEAFPTLRFARDAGYGLDLLLTSPQMVALVTDGVSALGQVGVDVMLPANWMAEEPSLALRTKPIETDPTGPAGRRSEPKLGFNQLVSYEWKLSIGDIELNESELRQLAASGSGLVQLRDKWVHADPAVAREALRFLVEQTKAGEETGAGTATLKELHFPGGAESQAPVVVEPLHTGWLNGVLGMGDESPDGESESGADNQPGAAGGEEGDEVTNLFRVPVPAGLNGQLRNYQQRGLEWLSRMSDNGFGVILADDMGLGKTIQVLALLQHEKELDRKCAPSLLVVPTGVLRNWAKEAQKFTPELSVGVLHGSNRPKDAELVEFVGKHDLVVTSYGIATREQALLKQLEWEHVIADEAQAIKNPNSQASRALRSFRARQNIAMTGTPVENDLGELRAIMDFCNPRMLGSAQAFRNRFAIPIERDGNEEMLAQLRTLTAPFILRRMKSDPAIAPDLPQKNENIESVALTAEQAMLYQSCVKDLERKIAEMKQNRQGNLTRRGIILSGITKLKQICNHPAHYQHDGSPVLHRGQHRSGKLERLDSLLAEILDGGERALVFTQFVEFGDMVSEYLTRRLGEEIPFIKGSLTPSQRERLVSEFNGPDGPPVMILSTLAAGVGINLTAANHVIHLDRWWNPAVENQATDRAYRIGQRKDVHVHKLVSIGTLEERIDELIFEKSVLADAVVKAGETKLTELEFEQLHAMWRLDQERINYAKKVAETGQPAEEGSDG